MDIVTAFENFPHFNLMDLKSVKPDDIKTDSQGSSYFTSIIDIEPTDEVYKDGATNTANKRGSQTQPQRTDKSIGFYPSWKTLALASLATTTKRGDVLATKQSPFFLEQPKLLLENSSQEANEDDDENENENDSMELFNSNKTSMSQKTASLPMDALDTVSAIENELARAHDLLDLELSGHGFKRSPAAAASLAKHKNAASVYGNMPAGIRSAIVASAAIVLTSMTTFMVIFIVCRWKQRKRRKTNYLKTYNAMKSKLPTITTTSRRSSLRNMEEMIGGVTTIKTSSSTQQLHRQSSLLFPRNGSDSACSITTTHHGNFCTSGRVMSTSLGSNSRGGATGSGGGGGGVCSGGAAGGLGSTTGSTTSLALSLQSAHNISSTKLNTMDPNSPEVQEYLFDTLRKSF